MLAEVVPDAFSKPVTSIWPSAQAPARGAIEADNSMPVRGGVITKPENPPISKQVSLDRTAATAERSGRLRTAPLHTDVSRLIRIGASRDHSLPLDGIEIKP